MAVMAITFSQDLQAAPDTRHFNRLFTSKAEAIKAADWVLYLAEKSAQKSGSQLDADNFRKTRKALLEAEIIEIHADCDGIFGQAHQQRLLSGKIKKTISVCTGVTHGFALQNLIHEASHLSLGEPECPADLNADKAMYYVTRKTGALMPFPGGGVIKIGHVCECPDVFDYQVRHEPATASTLEKMCVKEERIAAHAFTH